MILSPLSFLIKKDIIVVFNLTVSKYLEYFHLCVPVG